MMSDILLMCCTEAQLHTSVCSCKLNCLIKAQRSMSCSILFTRLVKQLVQQEAMTVHTVICIYNSRVKFAILGMRLDRL